MQIIRKEEITIIKDGKTYNYNKQYKNDNGKETFNEQFEDNSGNKYINNDLKTSHLFKENIINKYNKSLMNN